MRSTAVCFDLILPSQLQGFTMLTSLLRHTVDKAVEYILSQPDAN
jgi:hypothetical protein